jgi:hypothetical protein
MIGYKGKDKVVCLHAVKAYRGVEDIRVTPHPLNLDVRCRFGQLHAPATFFTGKQEARWTSEPVWALWRR